MFATVVLSLALAGCPASDAPEADGADALTLDAGDGATDGSGSARGDATADARTTADAATTGDAAATADAVTTGDANVSDARVLSDATDARVLSDATDAALREPDAAPPDAGQPAAARALGEVTPLGAEACETATIPDARCERVAVRCPDLEPDIEAILRIADPTSQPARGWILLGSGLGGSRLLGDDDGGADELIRELRARGFGTIERAWKTSGRGGRGWFTAETGVAAAACRLATLVRHLGATVAQPGPLCAHGHSGGSIELAEALAFYGVDGDLALASFSGGPVHDFVDVCWYGEPDEPWGMACAARRAAPGFICRDAAADCTFVNQDSLNVSYGMAAPCGGDAMLGVAPLDASLGLLAPDAPTAAAAQTRLATRVLLMEGELECGALGMGALEYAARLAAAGTDVTVTTVPGSSHSIFQTNERPPRSNAVLLADRLAERCAP